MEAIVRNIKKEQFHLYNIPDDFAEEAEMIILAVKPSKKHNQLSEDEAFYAATNEQVIEDDKTEDQIWSKYL